VRHGRMGRLTRRAGWLGRERTNRMISVIRFAVL
jgi:hypothetical protein